MIKGLKSSIISFASNATMFVLGLLLLTLINGCVTHPTATTSSSFWYRYYGLGSYEDVIQASSVPILIKALNDSNYETRRYAAEALRMIGPEAKDAVPALINALNDSNNKVRWAAVRALGGIRPEVKGTVPALIKALNDSNNEVRWAAVRALGGIGPEVKGTVPALIKALSDSNNVKRRYTAEALRMIGPEAKDAVPALIKALNDSNFRVRCAAAEALGGIGPEAKDAVPALIKALSDSDIGVRCAAAEALGGIGPEVKETIPALIKALNDSKYQVRGYAAEALGKIGPEAKDAVPALIKALSHNDPWVRFNTIEALGNIGPEARESGPDLIKALGDNSEDVRETAELAIVKVTPEIRDLIPVLIKALADSNTMLRYGAVKMLGKIAPPDNSVFQALITLILNDLEPGIRKESISLLRQMDYTGNDFLETLEKIANDDPDDSVKKFASDTLLNIKFDILASGKTLEPKSTSTEVLPLSEKQKPTSPREDLGQRWAVVIGISRYQDTRIPTLRYASNDAESFYKWLISTSGGKYAPGNVRLLLDEDGSFRNIRDTLFVWLKQVIEEDVVTIYFAGHGSPDSPDTPDNLFLLPYDAEYDSISTTGFPMWDIETALKRFIKARKVIVIADACHAGGVGQSFDVARRDLRGFKLNPISIGLQNLSKVGDGICIISASDDKQFSQESEKWGGGHGVFTYFLLQGLTGEADYNKDNTVNLGELIPYLSEQVRRATKNSQSPTVAGKFDPALRIGR